MFITLNETSENNLFQWNGELTKKGKIALLSGILMTMPDTIVTPGDKANYILNMLAETGQTLTKTRLA